MIENKDANPTEKQAPTQEVPAVEADKIDDPAPQEAPDMGTSVPEVSADNIPSSNPEVVEPITPQVKVIKKVLHRTRYTWNVYHSANENAPAFTVSLIENDPGNVATKFWEVLNANVSLKEVGKYKPRLSSLEVMG